MTVGAKAPSNAEDSTVSFDLQGKVAWLNGASGTLGRAIASALATEGATVVLSSRSEPSLRAVSADLEAAHPGRTSVLAVDLTNREQVDAAAQRIAADFGRIDMLVNSTSLSIFGEFATLADEDWLAVYEAKFFGYMRAIRAVLPQMIRQNDGRIVNVSGRGGHQPTTPVHMPGMTANAAVNLLTKGLANAYAKHGIRINAVAPGPVASPRYDAIVQAGQRQRDPGAGPFASGSSTVRTLGAQADPQEVADVVLFLLSDRSRLLTGSVFQADGGSTASL